MPHALLIESEPEDALLLGLLLEREGMQVSTVGDLGAAAALCEAESPDLIVLDGGDADATVARCRALRRDAQFADTPLLAVSAGQPDALRGAGADAVLRKPVVAGDLTQRVRDALKKAAEDPRADWVRYLVHDLNNPLAVLGGTLSMMEMGELDERQRGALGHARAAQDRLSRMVRGLLDIQRVQAGGQLKIARCPLPLSDLLHATASALGTIAAARKQTLRVEAESGTVVVGDHEALLRALVNFGENALRHGPRGSEVVLGGGAKKLWVRDHGPGVPPERREEIFTPFAQGPEGGSAGLGLAWCRLVAEAHGGRAFVEDAEGGGARFIIEID